MAAPAEQKKPESKKAKRPSALKRDLQSQKRRSRNRAIRGFETSLAQKQAPEVVKEKLNRVYSLMDKAVKKGVYKAQKAARTKSRLSHRS